MKEFMINEDFVCSVPVYSKIQFVGYDKEYDTFGHEDHVIFKQLRERLGELGLIEIERGWCNGDRVLEPFKLNDKLFEVGDKFLSAGAMSYHLKR